MKIRIVDYPLLSHSLLTAFSGYVDEDNNIVVSTIVGGKFGAYFTVCHELIHWFVAYIHFPRIFHFLLDVLSYIFWPARISIKGRLRSIKRSFVSELK